MLIAAKIILLASMGGSLIWLFTKLLKGGRGGKTFWGSLLMGLAALFVVCIMGQILSETLYVNPYTLGTSAVLGIPGVILMVVIKILWQL